ncbi:MAG: AraC family transcriptional regulator [Sphaerochaeta sp.]
MIKQQIKDIIDRKTKFDGLIDSGIKGIKLFRISETHRCAPVVYEPVVIAILSGTKEAILDGKSYLFDSNKYFCCPMYMPVEAGTPQATPEAPLLGVYISLDTKIMRDMSIEMVNSLYFTNRPKNNSISESLTLSDWDKSFSEALLRLLQLTDNKLDAEILGEIRLKELYYSILKGDSGESILRAFGVENEIARSIEYISSNFDKSLTIDTMAAQVGMSRAVFHRKFKLATTMSPMQFIKSIRLNNGAMKLIAGMNVNEVAIQTGYVSYSQFSREFKRLYGKSPKKWISSLKTT